MYDFKIIQWVIFRSVCLISIAHVLQWQQVDQQSPDSFLSRHDLIFNPFSSGSASEYNISWMYLTQCVSTGRLWRGILNRCWTFRKGTNFTIYPEWPRQSRMPHVWWCVSISLRSANHLQKSDYWSVFTVTLTWLLFYSSALSTLQKMSPKTWDQQQVLYLNFTSLFYRNILWALTSGVINNVKPALDNLQSLKERKQS